MTLLMSHLLVGVAGEGSNASGIWYTRSTGSGIFVNVGVRTWRIGSKQDATGVRPSRAGKPGDLVGPWVLRVLGEHKGSLCYMQRRTPQFYARAHQGNLTYPEFLARLEASLGCVDCMGSMNLLSLLLFLVFLLAGIFLRPLSFLFFFS